MDKKDLKLTQSEIEKAERDLPGVAINVGDDEAESPELVKERTATLNNNPENEGKII